jgi:hypothetical protein
MEMSTRSLAYEADRVSLLTVRFLLHERKWTKNVVSTTQRTLVNAVCGVMSVYPEYHTKYINMRVWAKCSVFQCLWCCDVKK